MTKANLKNQRLTGAEYLAMCRMRQVSERCKTDKAKLAAITLELHSLIKANAISFDTDKYSVDEVARHLFDVVWASDLDLERGLGLK